MKQLVHAATGLFVTMACFGQQATIGDIQGLENRRASSPSAGVAQPNHGIVRLAPFQDIGNCRSNPGAGRPRDAQPEAISRIIEIPAGAANGVNQVFSLAHVPNPPNSLVVTRNGLSLRTPDDYTVSGTIITFSRNSVPRVKDTIYAAYSVVDETVRQPVSETGNDSDIDRVLCGILQRASGEDFGTLGLNLRPARTLVAPNTGSIVNRPGSANSDETITRLIDRLRQQSGALGTQGGAAAEDGTARSAQTESDQSWPDGSPTLTELIRRTQVTEQQTDSDNSRRGISEELSTFFEKVRRLPLRRPVKEEQ